MIAGEPICSQRPEIPKPRKDLTIFISSSFDLFAKSVADWVQNIFVTNGIDAYISGQAEAKSLPESIRERIRSCEAMVTIFTDRFSA